MSATAWFIIAIVGFSLSGVALATAVFMFIKMNIPSVVGDLSGKTVAREIKAIREFNEANGDRRFRPSAVNLERGTLTDKVIKTAETTKSNATAQQPSISGQFGAKVSPPRRPSGTVGLGAGSVAPAEPIPSSASETEVLTDGTEVLTDGTEVLTDGTEVLSNGTEVLTDGTEVLTDGTEVLTNGTEVLTDGTEVLTDGTTVLSEGTTVLSRTDELEEKALIPVAFKVIDSRILIHSDEVIK